VNGKSDLRRFGDLRESETLELKESFNQRAVETAGAFANTAGGTILVGVDEGGTIRGAPVTEETLKDWAVRISNASEPTVVPDVSTVQVEGMAVGVIQVREHPMKPVAIRGRCYRRVGASNRQMTPSEITELHLHSRGMTWDMVPSPGSSIEDLDMGRVRDYVERARRIGRRTFPDDEAPSVILEKTGLVRDGRPTWAAMLAFGDRPPLQARVRCGRIRGTHTIVDAFEVDAPLLEQVDEVMAYMRRVLQLSFVLTGQARRTEVWEYPLEAVREAVTNAVCHRDYASSAEVLVRVFDDELVISNPGSLPLGMTMGMLMDPRHGSVPRNRQIAMLFHDVELIERYGSGIGRILAECDRLGVPRPEFTEQEHGFQVVFRKDIYHEANLRAMGLNERQILALIRLKVDGRITNRAYQEVTGVSERTALRDLRDLTDRGLLERHGRTGRDTEYRLTCTKPATNPP